mmetsp:Transcript_1031/g.2648  ORF Transcript_1031/g.2648 Transcript_1031/m.2648 type:complete len:428 (-) Transcript_1031:507-1790(-)
MGAVARDRRPGLHQHPPQACRQAGGGGRGAGRRHPFRRAPGDRQACDGGVRVGQPHRPAACGPCAPGGARRCAVLAVQDPGPPGHARVLLQRRRRADRHPRQFHADAAQGLQARRRRMARGGLQRRLHPGHRRRLRRQANGEGRRPRVHRLGRRGRPRQHPPVRGGLSAPRAGPGPAGLWPEVRQLLPGEQRLRRRAAGEDGRAPGGQWQDLRGGRRPVAAHHRLRRRQGPRDAQEGRWLHLLRARRGLSHQQVRARLHAVHQHPGHRPPRHHRPGARRPAGGQPRHPAGLPGLCAAQDGHGHEERRGGQDLQARRLLCDAARPGGLDQPRRGALLPDQPQGRHRVHLRRRPGAEAERREPGVLCAVRPCPHLLRDPQMGGRHGRRRRQHRCRRPGPADRADRGGADAQARRLPRHADQRGRRPGAA